MRKIGLAIAFGAAALLGFPGISSAQHSHGGGGHSSGGHSSGGHASSFSSSGGHASGYYGGHASGYYGGNIGGYYGGRSGGYYGLGGYYGGFGRGGLYGRYWYPGIGFFVGSPLWFNYPWGYSRYDYGIGAPYYSGDYYYGSADTYAPAATSYYPPENMAPPAGSEDPNAVNMEVRVPENATLWIQGQKADPTGAVRHFVSPPLAKDQTFTYDLRARWTDANGKPVERTKKVDVKAGAWIGVDFSKP